MPKLFQINVSLNTGSIGRIAENIGSVAEKQGWEVWIAHGPRYVNKSVHHIYQICSRREELLHVFKSRLLDGYGLGCTKATKKLIKKIEYVQPDLIHLHNIHGYYLNYHVLFDFLKEAGIPVVWSIHDCWPFTGHCAHFDTYGCTRWIDGCHDCPKQKLFPASYFIDRSMQNYALKRECFTSLSKLTLAPVSDWLHGLLKQSFFRANEAVKITTIHNGTDLDIFSPKGKDVDTKTRERYGLTGKFVGIALASRWGNEKGWSDYLELSQILSDNMTIVLVGVNKKQKESLPSNIIGLERTDNIEELAKLYSAADVLMNLSYLESFGLTTVEGYASGIPAIVYDKTASPELVENGTGYVVKAGNMKEVLSKMVEIQKNGKQAYTYVCRECAELRFNVKKQYQKYLDLYNSIIE